MQLESLIRKNWMICASRCRKTKSQPIADLAEMALFIAQGLVLGSIYVGMDVTNIGDPGCPGVAIQLSVSDDAYRRKDIHAFERNVRKHGMGATATVEGQFHAKASVLPYPMPAIDMHAIKNVVFEAK